MDRSSRGKLSGEKVYYLYLAAYNDRDRAEKAECEFELDQMSRRA